MSEYCQAEARLERDFRTGIRLQGEVGSGRAFRHHGGRTISLTSVGRRDNLGAMKRGVVALAIAAALIFGSPAAPGATHRGCALGTVVGSLFPKAGGVGFGLRKRIDHGRQPRRAPFYPGYCGQWWTQYSGPGGYVDVSITIYRTSRQVDAPLGEPAYRSLQVLGSGARVRVAADGSGVVSGMRNVFVSSVSSFLPADVNGVPNFAGGPDLPVGIHMRIHRLVHQAVIRVG